MRTLLAGAVLLAALAAGAGPQGTGLVLGLRADKPVYLPGERIPVTLEVTNPAPDSHRLTFRTSQRFDLALEDAGGREVWRWSRGRYFLQVIGEEILKSGSDGLRFRTEVPAPSARGRYLLRGWITSTGPPLTTSTTIQVR